MTKIVIPDDLTLFHSEAKRLREERDALKAKLREAQMQSLADLGQAQMAWEAQKAAEEELAKVREVNAEQAKTIERLLEERRQDQQRARMARSGE